MRILLLAPVHREREYLKERSKPFPSFQGQSSWYRAFNALGHQVWVFKYTDSILLPNIMKTYIQNFFAACKI